MLECYDVVCQSLSVRHAAEPHMPCAA